MATLTSKWMSAQKRTKLVKMNNKKLEDRINFQETEISQLKQIDKVIILKTFEATLAIHAKEINLLQQSFNNIKQIDVIDNIPNTEVSLVVKKESFHCNSTLIGHNDWVWSLIKLNCWKIF